jgi:hypothetical protein
LSVAFTREESAETASETLLPDRPISSNPNLVTETGLKALERQLREAREVYEAAQKTEDENEKGDYRPTPRVTFAILWRDFERLGSFLILHLPMSLPLVVQ